MKHTGIADKGKSTLRRIGLERLGQKEVSASPPWHGSWGSASGLLAQKPFMCARDVEGISVIIIDYIKCISETNMFIRMSKKKSNSDDIVDTGTFRTSVIIQVSFRNVTLRRKVR